MLPLPTPIEIREDHGEAWRAYLKERRIEQKARLAAYIALGKFPWNDDEPGLVNIFVDDEGARCAMANLVFLDGHGELVAAIAAGDRDYRFTRASTPSRKPRSTSPLSGWATGCSRPRRPRWGEVYSSPSVARRYSSA